MKNQKVIDLFVKETAAFQRLTSSNNASTVQIYPNISSRLEKDFRMQFGIDDEETILYVHEINVPSNKGFYETLGLVITDLGIRATLLDPMFCAYSVFSNCIKYEYDENGFITILDSHCKVDAEAPKVPVFWFKLDSDERDGRFLVRFLNSTSDISLEAEESDKLEKGWVKQYMNLQIQREKKGLLKEDKENIAAFKEAKSLVKEMEKEQGEGYLLKYAIGGICIVLGVIIGVLCTSIEIGVCLGALGLYFISQGQMESPDEEIDKQMEKEDEEELANLEATYKKHLQLSEESEDYIRMRQQDAEKYVFDTLYSNSDNSEEKSDFSWIEFAKDVKNGYKLGKILAELTQYL